MSGDKRWGVVPIMLLTIACFLMLGTEVHAGISTCGGTPPACSGTCAGPIEKFCGTTPLLPDVCLCHTGSSGGAALPAISVQGLIVFLLVLTTGAGLLVVRRRRLNKKLPTSTRFVLMIVLVGSVSIGAFWLASKANALVETSASSCSSTVTPELVASDDRSFGDTP